MKTMNLTQLRAAFWRAFPEFASLKRSRKTQNDYPTDVRVTWCDFVEAARSNGEITDRVAERATL
jgi:hypothetical protein